MKWVIFNLAHKYSSIKSSDGEAWIRILGFFENKEKAIGHAKNLSSKVAGGMETRLAPISEFRVLLNKLYTDAQGNPDLKIRQEEINKHAFLMQRHAEKRSFAFEEAAKNASNKTAGPVIFKAKEYLNDSSSDLNEPSLKEIIFKKDEDSNRASSGSSKLSSPLPVKENVGIPSISKDDEIRMQKFAAIAVIPDYQHEEELFSMLRNWISKRDQEYVNVKNSLVREKVGDKNSAKFPSMKNLFSGGIPKCGNPPRGWNVHGQRILVNDHQEHQQNIWDIISNHDCNGTSDPSGPSVGEYMEWKNKFSQEYDENVWKWLGYDTPPDIHSSEIMKSWIIKNPLPFTSMNGSEPAVAFLHAAETEDELKQWINTKLTIKDTDVACVTMYEWLKVENAFNNKVHKNYREPLLDKLHRNKDSQGREAELIKGAVKEIEILAN